MEANQRAIRALQAIYEAGRMSSDNGRARLMATIARDALRDIGHAPTRNMIAESSTCSTTPKFWDCECTELYIHPKSVTQCLHCSARADDQPDSRITEVYP
jgi:hypothetical protein